MRYSDVNLTIRYNCVLLGTWAIQMFCPKFSTPNHFPDILSFFAIFTQINRFIRKHYYIFRNTLEQQWLVKAVYNCINLMIGSECYFALHKVIFKVTIYVSVSEWWKIVDKKINKNNDHPNSVRVMFQETHLVFWPGCEMRCVVKSTTSIRNHMWSYLTAGKEPHLLQWHYQSTSAL